jgi:hypothetical protein
VAFQDNPQKMNKIIEKIVTCHQKPNPASFLSLKNTRESVVIGPREYTLTFKGHNHQSPTTFDYFQLFFDYNPIFTYASLSCTIQKHLTAKIYLFSVFMALKLQILNNLLYPSM